MDGNVSINIAKSITLEKVAFKILIESYDHALIYNQYKLDWKEEQFSQYLLSLMEDSKLRVKHQLFIRLEEKLHKKRFLPIGINNPKVLPRIDISIASWMFEQNIEKKFFFEAKNLCERNWKKKVGTRVSSKYYLDRYISTGIENFRIGRYYDGAIIGYVLNGKTSNIVKKLNMRLAFDSNTIRNINKTNFTRNFNDIYNSMHLARSKKLELKHIFLKF
jgi:hypothetical protein